MDQSSLSNKTFIQYLKHVIALETSILNQDKIRSQLSTAYYSKEPRKPSTPYFPQRPEMSYTDRSERGNAAAAVVCGVILGIIGAILAIASFAYGLGFGGVFGLLLAALGFGIAISRGSKSNSITTKNNDAIQNWENECSSIQASYDSALKGYQTQYPEWQAASTIYDASSSIITNSKNETQRILNQLYAVDLIYPKYRNLVALTSICEYFETGRCDSLAGPNGAYNLYEDEIRRNMIISQLNTIIDKLDQIKNTQYLLYTQLVDVENSNRTLLAALNSVPGFACDIRVLPAFQTYYDRLIAKNTDAVAFLETLNKQYQS